MRLMPLLLVPMLAPLTGCQPRRSEASLVVASKSRLSSLDPAQAISTGAMQVLAAIGDPLYAINAEGEVEPRLAAGPPELSADGLRARIPLRRDVRFHDGTRFDAAAMVFSLERFMAIGKLSYVIGDRVEAVRASGPHEIELTLKRPFGPLARMLSAAMLTPVSPTAYAAHRDEPLNDRFVGTGPYRVSFYNDQQQRLRPFSGYWGQRPANGGIDLVTLSNSTALFGALRSGEVDVLLSTSLESEHKQALHRDAERGRLNEGIGPALEINYLTLLSDQPPLNDPTLRRAIALSLDRRTIKERVGLGMHPSLRQLVPPSLPGSDPTAWPAYDPEAARRLYRRAGYCNGKPLALPLTFRSNIPIDRLFALTWQAQLRRDLDDCVKLEVSGMESTTAIAQLDKGVFPMILLDWTGDYPDADNYLTPLLSCEETRNGHCVSGNSALSGSFWTAPGLDAKLQRSTQVSSEASIPLVRAIQQRVAAASPYIPVSLLAPVAWARPQVSVPRFDGSGRVMLTQLQRRPGGQP